MPSYYTVDRSGCLSPGFEVGCNTDFTTCGFFPVQDHFTRVDLENVTRQLFPAGLTNHGKKYLLDECLVITTQQGPAPYVPHIPMIEVISELVRRTFFSDRPSRLSVVFAWSTFEEAVTFQQQHGVGTIYEVQADTFFQGDMNLLYLGGSGIGALLLSMKYWRGESSPTPRWEYLLVPPVRVVAVASS